MAKGKLIFEYEKCKGCELCVAACPKKILTLDPKKINQKGYNLVTVVDENACIACAFCATMCPDSVITVIKEA